MLSVLNAILQDNIYNSIMRKVDLQKLLKRLNFFFLLRKYIWVANNTILSGKNKQFIYL